MTSLPRVMAVLFLLFQTGPLVAQNGAPGATPSTHPEAVPNLDLTAAQKQTIYTSATNLNMKNEAPPDFQPIVGAVIPQDVKLEKMPKTIVELTPRLADFEIGLIANQVVIVDPKSRKVVEVIVGEKK